MQRQMEFWNYSARKMPIYFSLMDTANPPHEAMRNFSTLLLVTTFFVMV